MDEGKRYEVCQWLIKSQRDLGAAGILLRNEEVYLDIVVYHCQQAVEKAMKGYLTYEDSVFEKTHNLSRLLALCTSRSVVFKQWEEMAEILTPYATAFRYPGEVLEPSQSEAEQALEMAGLFVDFVIKALPGELALEG
jgi:HEPN domain-containing protein